IYWLKLPTNRAPEVTVFVNRMPHFEILDPDAIGTLERGWRRILTDVGIAFDHPEAIALLRAAGQRVEGEVAFLDPEFVLEPFALQTLSDQAYFGSVTSAENARDSIKMTEILYGGREQIEAVPALLAIVNVNSPLRYDGRMLAALIEYARAGQAPIITPFLLM